MFSPCRAVRAVDVRVVPELLFTGVTKLAAAEGPETSPIIPGVAILARPGLPEDARGSVSDKEGKWRSLKQLNWL